MKKILLILFLCSVQAYCSLAQPLNTYIWPLDAGGGFQLIFGETSTCSGTGCTTCSGNTSSGIQYGFYDGVNYTWGSATGGRPGSAIFSILTNTIGTFQFQYVQRTYTKNTVCGGYTFGAPTLVKLFTISIVTNFEFDFSSLATAMDCYSNNIINLFDYSNYDTDLSFEINDVAISSANAAALNLDTYGTTIKVEYIYTGFSDGIRTQSANIVSRKGVSLTVSFPDEVNVCTDASLINLSAQMVSDGPTKLISCIAGSCPANLLVVVGSETFLNPNVFGNSVSFTSSIRFRATNASGFCVKEKTIVFKVGNAYTIDAGTNQTVCINNAVINLNTANGVNLSSQTPIWTGPGVSGNTFDPQLAGTGTHTIQLETINVGGCRRTDTKTITVNALPIVTRPVAGSTIDICSGTGSIWLPQPTDPLPTGGTYSSTNATISGKLTNSDLNLSGIAVGTYPMTYTVTQNGCSRAVNFNISIIQGATTPIVADKVNCNTNQSASLIVSNVTTGNDYKWYATPTSSAVLFTGNNFTTPALNATTTYYVSATRGNCVSPRDAATVTVVDLSNINAGPDFGACDNNISINLNDPIYNVSPAGGTWSGPGVTGNTFTGNGLQNNNSYVLTYTVTQNGCQASDTRTIALGFDTEISISSTTVKQGTLVEFNHNYPNAIETEWDFGDGWKQQALEGNHYYYSEGPKTIKVFIKLPAGCNQTFTFPNALTVEPFNIVTDVTDDVIVLDKISVFPNPLIDNNINIKVNKSGKANLTLIDYTGKIYESFLGYDLKEGVNTIQLKNLPEGFFVLIVGNGKESQTFKLIK